MPRFEQRTSGPKRTKLNHPSSGVTHWPGVGCPSHLRLGTAIDAACSPTAVDGEGHPYIRWKNTVFWGIGEGENLQKIVESTCLIPSTQRWACHDSLLSLAQKARLCNLHLVGTTKKSSKTLMVIEFSVSSPVWSYLQASYQCIVCCRSSGKSRRHLRHPRAWYTFLQNMGQPALPGKLT